MKKILILIFLFMLIPVVKAEEEDLAPNAKSAIMIEASTGEILFQKNKEERLAPASMTKMMSMLLIMEEIEKGNLKWDEMITASERASSMGGSQIFLKVGEKMSVTDMLKGISIASGNDATVAMAERISGSEESFVKKMNDRAKELGLKNTNFKNCIGFDEKDHYSTAYDMALIARELITHEEIFSFSGIYEDYIRKGTANESWISNTNKLVKFYPGADGLKTGWTDEAGSCICATAMKNDLRLIVVSLGYEHNNVRNSETMDLLNYGFNQYKVNVLYKKGDVVSKEKLLKADEEEVKLIAQSDVLILQKKTEEEKKYTEEIKLDDVSYPIKKGTKLGTIYIKDGDKIINKSILVAEKDIDKMNIFKLFLTNLKNILTGN